jgi:hypothetical protein
MITHDRGSIPHWRISVLVAHEGRISPARAEARDPLASRLRCVLHKIIIPLSKAEQPANPFDCVAMRNVMSDVLGTRMITMLDAVTALFGVISAGIFLAHAVDGYWSR